MTDAVEALRRRLIELQRDGDPEDYTVALCDYLASVAPRNAHGELMPMAPPPPEAAKCQFCAGTGKRDEGDRNPHWVTCRYCKGTGKRAAAGEAVDLRERIECLERSRPLSCYDCGRRYEKGPDLCISNEDWKRIAPHDGQGVLCPNCMHDRFVALGVKNGSVRAAFGSGPFAEPEPTGEAGKEPLPPDTNPVLKLYIENVEAELATSRAECEELKETVADERWMRASAEEVARAGQKVFGLPHDFSDMGRLKLRISCEQALERAEAAESALAKSRAECETWKTRALNTVQQHGKELHDIFESNQRDYEDLVTRARNAEADRDEWETKYYAEKERAEAAEKVVAAAREYVATDDRDDGKRLCDALAAYYAARGEGAKPT